MVLMTGYCGGLRYIRTCFFTLLQNLQPPKAAEGGSCNSHDATAEGGGCNSQDATAEGGGCNSHDATAEGGGCNSQDATAEGGGCKSGQVTLVTVQWLEDCLTRGKLLDTEHYRIATGT